MNRLIKPTLAAGVSCVLLALTSPAFAQTVFNGNGNTGFGGAVGNGSLTVSNDGAGFAAGSGFVDFSFTLQGTTLGSLGNNIVIYLDNGLGGGITSSTSSYVTSTGDGGRSAVTQNSGNGSFSILGFGGLMAPQYAIELDQFNFGQIYTDTGGVPTFIDGTSSGNTTGGGLSYLVSGDTASINIPVSDFGLTAGTLGNLELASMEVSATGFSSNEGTEGVTGNSGYQASSGQTLTSVDSFTVVPEPSSVMTMLMGSSLLGSFYLIRRKRK